MSTPDTITVEVESERMVHADRADLLVRISGSSLISGDTVLKKAAEVRELVEALAAAGIGGDQVRVDGIHANSSSGLIGKSSSVTYSLRVEVPSMEKVAQAAGIIATRKNAALDRIQWHYDELEAIRQEMLSDALSRAQARSAVICRVLGQRIEGVHALQETLGDGRDNHGAMGRVTSLSSMSTMPTGIVADSSSIDLGVDVTHAKRVILKVRVEYRVSPIES